MKTTLIIVGLFILVGCSHTPYVDAEYGLAYQETLDQQVAFPAAPFANQNPEGLDGITAEEVMSLHNQTYAEKPEGVSSMTFGLLGGSSSGN